jgi:hypothetical protein
LPGPELSRKVPSLRCLFCKLNSDASTSVEHVLPESLGNTTLILPKGVVCDGCNNYFARKVEAPFLNAPAVKALRAWQSVPNKRGRLVALPGTLMGEFPVTAYLRRHTFSSLDIGTFAVWKELEKRRGAGHRIALDFFSSAPSPPDDAVVSRFLAKAGLEAMALKCVDHSIALDGLIDDPQLDPIREHARRGDPRVKWPYSKRRIYDMDKMWTDPDGVNQRVHEHHLFVTEHHELYFVVALFGLEFAFNVAGPDIDGYYKWLREHDHVSPLYWGPLAHSDY